MNKKLTCENRCLIKDNEKEEEVEYIWVVVANMNFRAPLLAAQTILGLIPIVGLITSIFPRCEHHGIVFKTKNGNYYSADFVEGGSEFKNHYKNKEEAFQYIAKKVSQKKVWIYYKGKALEIIKIGEIINLINKVTPEKYHLLFQNCQSFVRYVMKELQVKIIDLGFNTGWTSGHMAAGIAMGGDRSY